MATIDSARVAFTTGDLVSAEESFQEIVSDSRRFSDAAQLDLSMVELAKGDAAAAEQRLRSLRDQFDRLSDVAPVHELAALATDDTARRYQPAGYEEVMVRAMLAVCSLAKDQADAESYALQATKLQSDLAKEAESRGVVDFGDVYQPIALTPYLRGVLREATHRDYDDAAAAYRLVSDIRPEFAPVGVDIARAEGGVHSQPGHGVLYVIACVGRGPVLREAEEPTTSAALTIASSFWNAKSNDDEDEQSSNRTLPNIASVKVPVAVIPPSQIASIGVRIDGTLYGATQTLTDVGELAARQVESEMPWTIARAVVRRAAKEAAVAKATDTLGLSGNAGSLFHFATATAWSATERADTRCWGLLPREIQVFRSELPVGDHTVQLDPLGFAGPAIAAGRTKQMRIVDGRNHYLIVIAPNDVLYLAN